MVLNEEPGSQLGIWTSISFISITATKRKKNQCRSENKLSQRE